MRSICRMETVQIDVTSHCTKQCSGCTHLIGHSTPWNMSMQKFKQAVDSMVGFNSMVGMIGGDPILHPHFKEMCEYLHSKIPKEKCGLWTCFPKGFAHYREVIEMTFGNIFLNDQTRDDILHAPVLVSAREIPIPQWTKRILQDECWVQNSWSASITPKGAFFCEVAAALNGVLGLNYGWPVEPEWWTRSPLDFSKQRELCDLCGAAMPLQKRASTEITDDISPEMFDLLKDISPKLKQKKYNIHNLEICQDNRQTATYKDANYRQGIAARYGMFLTVNSQGYCTPHLKSDYVRKEE